MPCLPLTVMWQKAANVIAATVAPLPQLLLYGGGPSSRCPALRRSAEAARIRAAPGQGESGSHVARPLLVAPVSDCPKVRFRLASIRGNDFQQLRAIRWTLVDPSRTSVRGRTNWFWGGRGGPPCCSCVSKTLSPDFRPSGLRSLTLGPNCCGMRHQSSKVSRVWR